MDYLGYLFAGFAVFWAGLFAYLLWLQARLRGVSRQLELLEERLAEVDERTHSPIWAILFELVLITLMLVWSILSTDFQTWLALGVLAGVVTVVIVAVAAFVFPERRPDLYQASPANLKIAGIPVLNTALAAFFVGRGRTKVTLAVNVAGNYLFTGVPVADGVGYGLRVPGLVISPYARRGVIDHQTLSSDAYLKFIEDLYLGGARLELGPVVDDHHVAGGFLVKAHQGTHGVAAEVHEGLRLHQQHVVLADAAARR